MVDFAIGEPDPDKKDLTDEEFEGLRQRMIGRFSKKLSERSYSRGVFHGILLDTFFVFGGIFGWALADWYLGNSNVNLGVYVFGAILAVALTVRALLAGWTYKKLQSK